MRIINELTFGLACLSAMFIAASCSQKTCTVRGDTVTIRLDKPAEN